MIHSNRAIKHLQIRSGQNRPSRNMPTQNLGAPITGPVAHLEKDKLYAQIYNWKQEKAGLAALNADVWGQEIRKDLIHRVVVWQLAKYRQGTHKNLNRSEVAGSGRKMRPQKGGGTARIGNLKAPHMRGGGRAHAKVPRDYSYSLQKKVVSRALKISLSAKVSEKNLVVLESLDFDSHKTNEFATILKAWDAGKVLIIHGSSEVSSNAFLAGRNLPNLDFLPQVGANVYDILNHDTLFVTALALRELEERLTKPPKFAPKFIFPPNSGNWLAQTPAASDINFK